MTDAPLTIAEPPPETDPDIAGWEAPPREPPVDAAPILSIEGFEGPLDWLLEMARAQKLDLAKLSIAALIDSFATALEAALARRTGGLTQLGRWGHWLVMAATLTHLRSRLLLPADSPEASAAASEAEELRRRLLGRAELIAAADWLQRRPQLDRDVFARGVPAVQDDGRSADITDLLRACLVALRVPEEQAASFSRLLPLWSVTDAMARIGELLPLLPAESPLWACLPDIDDADPRRELRCAAAVASTLIAGLELARTGDLRLDQDALWAPVRVRPGERPGV